MSNNDLVLKDWEMTKDRIKHFDNAVIRMRLQALPIAAGILAVGLASSQYIQQIEVSIFSFSVSATSLILAFGSFYLMAIFALDMFHYWLLLISVRHAKQIEQLPKYKGKLQITIKLTSRKLTILHTACAIIVYWSIILSGLILACVF